MSIETKLNVTPYWDDYNEDKDFYRVLFKPGVAVQTRELNQIQTIVQKQIERFGDHVFKSGTIVSGVNFSYNSLFSYAKLRDIQEDGQPVDVSGYINFNVKNTANLQAVIVHYETGFETKDPDLNTIYLKYINAGDTYDQTAFSNDEVLEIYSRENIIFDVDVNNGGLSFSNTDTLYVISSLNVNVASGTFSNGEVITQATTGAKSQIVGIANGTSTTSKILTIKPLLNDHLANTSANSSAWTMSLGYNITGNTSSAVANVVSKIGADAAGSVVTDSLGVVQNIVMSNNGKGYTTLPVAVIKPNSNSASVSTLDLSPRTYKAKVRTANSTFTSPVGYGYSFSVSDGVIYQKGTFSRVSPQYVVISKYSSSPNGVSVGFKSDEDIVKYTTDSTLYDNAANTYNEGAPGADRLRIKPRLAVVNTAAAAANTDFLPLVEFVDGRPAKENRNSVYSELAKEFERRTFESAGNYVINRFDTTTKEIASNTTTINVVVDPGLAYISGKRVVTISNALKDVDKATAYVSKNNQTITANYGNYISVNELAGFFDFKSGATVNLQDTAQQRLTNVTIGSPAASGNTIGTARMRSIVYEDGVIGTPEASYRVYLFDIAMNVGKSFQDVKSLHYSGSYNGVADTIQILDGTTNAYYTPIYGTSTPDVIFNTGVSAVKSISDISYTYRTSTENLTLSSDGTLQITAPVTYTFPYSGSINLSATQKQDVIIAPVSNAQCANITGTVSGNTASANLVGSGTSFSSIFTSGDYVVFYGNTTHTSVRRVENVVNNTLMVLNANLAYTNTSTTAALFFPAHYPISFSDRTARTISTSANAAVMTANIAATLTATVNATAFYNVKIPSATQINKDLDRDLYVKIYTGNNATVSVDGNNTTGPWSLGVPDVFRLKTVYFGNTASNTDVTNQFFISSQNDGSIARNAELRLKPGSSLAISNTQWLLVKFDAYDVNAAEGFTNINSYNDIINDAAGYSNNTYINRLEVPEIQTNDGRYYDLIDTFDFRPYASNTAAYATTVGSATVNPSNTQSLSSDEKYFPAPDSQIQFDIDYYIPRIDLVSIDKDANIKVIKGTPEIKPKVPRIPKDSLPLSRLVVPPYPSLPSITSNTTFRILDKKVGNDSGDINNRANKYTARSLNFASDRRASAPKRFTMSDIGKIEKRVSQLEASLSLTMLEKQITDQVLASSNDPARQRFKNAFLVDGFDDGSIIDLTNKETMCFLQNSELVPLTFASNVDGVFDLTDPATSNNVINSSILLPYEEYSVVSQLGASAPFVPAVVVYEPEPTPVGVEYTEPYTPPPVTCTFRGGCGGYEPQPPTPEPVIVVPPPLAGALYVVRLSERTVTTCTQLPGQYKFVDDEIVIAPLA